MSDANKLDGQKLNYHPERVAAWRRGDNIYPIYMEISPTGACNHRCTFCGLDFMEYQARSLDTVILKKQLTELGQLGLKSVMYGGEGEPLIHPDIGEIITHTKKSGIDVALTTNGVLLTPDRAEPIITACRWIKISLDAGSAATYEKIHLAKPGDFDQVIYNIATARKIANKSGSACTIGVQIILLPENRHEVLDLAEIVKNAGADYLVVKPFSQHPMSETRRYNGAMDNNDLTLAERLTALETGSFKTIFRQIAMERATEPERGYDRCLALPFWSYIDAGGGVWGCSVFLGDERFLYGNINEQTFRDIWEGDRRRKSLEWVAEQLDANQCRTNCRMDQVNHFLWDMRQPPDHMNFI